MHRSAVATIGAVKSGRWQRLAAVLGTITALLLSGCTSSAPKPQTGPCQAGCTGVIGGAHYLIKVPHNWNGTLLVFSHGYQLGGTPPHLMLSPQDRSGTGDDALSVALLDKGFALAGSSWSSTGWAVQDGVDAADKLYPQFVKTVRKPTRVYVWGASLGGLVTEQLAEHADWVDGAAPMCGVVGGPLPNFDNWLEALVATQALLGPKFTYTGSLSATQAQTEDVEARTAINAARRDRSGGGAAKLVYIADLLGLPDKSSLSFHSGQSGAIGAATQDLSSYILNGLGFLAEARARFGGNPAKTHPASQSPITAAQRATITALHGNPDAFAATVDAAPAVPTSSAARAKLVASGNPTGDLQVPTVTLHDIYDPLAIAANESILHSLAAEQNRTNRLVQLFVGPYQALPSFGLDHCSFSTGEEVGLIDTLDQWVRQGPRPAQSDIVENLGPALAPTYDSPKWPSGAVH
jgi:hypothetical protein